MKIDSKSGNRRNLEAIPENEFNVQFGLAVKQLACACYCFSFENAELYRRAVLQMPSVPDAPGKKRGSSHHCCVRVGPL
jgi:hypothetical protein